jgi:hypothetical protein
MLCLTFESEISNIFSENFRDFRDPCQRNGFNLRCNFSHFIFKHFTGYFHEYFCLILVFSLLKKSKPRFAV